MLASLLRSPFCGANNLKRNCLVREKISIVKNIKCEWLSAVANPVRSMQDVKLWTQQMFGIETSLVSANIVWDFYFKVGLENATTAGF